MCVFAADSMDTDSKQFVNDDGIHVMNGDSNIGTVIALCKLNI